MCGICGELRFDGAPADLAAVARMTERLRPRGPDHGGAYGDGVLGFGHRRLAIIDLSERANQPMVDQELGLALVFNGTIYNYPELRRELEGKGYHFFSDGDSEVILKAYREWGEGAVARFHGMFAFAVWDMRERTLFLARDRFGIKPLYWSRDDRRFRFASNVQALLAGGGVDTRLDPEAIHFQFTLHGVVPAPRTVLKGVRKLEPGHWIKLDVGGGLQSESYWRIDPTPMAPPWDESRWVEAVHERLLEAVRRRNEIADVPVGVLLSGGLDSSLLVALLVELGHENLHTFTIGFEDQPEELGNEFEYSDQVVARFKPNHHKFLIPNDEVLDRLPEAVDAMAEPMFGQDAVAFYLLAEQVSKEIKVVQSGQGADEVFGGYFWYPRIMADRQGDCVDRLRRHYFDREHAEFLRMVTPPYRGADHTGQWVARRLEAMGAATCIDAVLALDVTAFIVDDPVKRVDNMTMAWGLEARVPFLDHELVELVARCPPDIKFRSNGKHLLKQVARGRVPDAVIDRPKGYFPMPALKYVRGPFLTFMRDILDSRACRERGLFERSYIDMLLGAPEMHHTRIQGSKLWQLALMELWLQRNVDPVSG